VIVAPFRLVRSLFKHRFCLMSVLSPLFPSESCATPMKDEGELSQLISSSIKTKTRRARWLDLTWLDWFVVLIKIFYPFDYQRRSLVRTTQLVAVWLVAKLAILAVFVLRHEALALSFMSFELCLWPQFVGWEVKMWTAEQFFSLQLKRELGNLLIPFMYIIWFSNFQFCVSNTTTERLLETSSRILIHFLFRNENFGTSISISFNHFIQKIWLDVHKH
jgi:hypothetical protein